MNQIQGAELLELITCSKILDDGLLKISGSKILKNFFSSPTKNQSHDHLDGHDYHSKMGGLYLLWVS